MCIRDRGYNMCYITNNDVVKEAAQVEPYMCDHHDYSKISRPEVLQGDDSPYTSLWVLESDFNEIPVQSYSSDRNEISQTQTFA